MYKIFKDKRAQESAEKILVAFDRLLDNHSYPSINVSMICHEADVSRTTFYRLFDTPSDIIRWNCNRSLELLRSDLLHHGVLEQGWPFRYVLQHIFRHPQALELASKAHRMDLADSAFYAMMTPLLEEMRVREEVSAVDIHYSGLIISAIIGAAFTAWLRDGKKESEEVLYERVLRIVRNIQ